MRLFRLLVRASRAPSEPRRSAYELPERPMPREMRIPVAMPHQPIPLETVIVGPCWVIDGDTIVIGGTHIRLAGIDAPELNHPWGQKSKWEMVRLCKGQVITARIKPELSYDRVVAECFLPDGRDLAAELVRVGLALDWPKFSGGKYRMLEPPDARKKLWRASLRQGGMLPPANRGSFSPATKASWQPAVMPADRERRARKGPAGNLVGWFAAGGVLLLMVGCSLAGGQAERTTSAAPATSAVPAGASPMLASFEVTAQALNIRRQPTAQSGVIGQLGKGTIVIPERISGAWYGVGMSDGTTGWVHRDYLSAIKQ